MRTYETNEGISGEARKDKRKREKSIHILFTQKSIKFYSLQIIELY